MRNLFLAIGLPDMAASQMFVVVALIVAAAFALAWIADIILGDGAFGVLLNTSILLVGAIGGMLAWRYSGYAPVVKPETSVGIATGSGIFLLLACGVMRRWI